MKSFILVRNSESKSRCLIAVSSIITVDELSDGSAYIITSNECSSNLKHTGSFGVSTSEDFDEVIDKIIEVQK